jgi:hypothetical protein
MELGVFLYLGHYEFRGWAWDTGEISREDSVSLSDSLKGENMSAPGKGLRASASWAAAWGILKQHFFGRACDVPTWQHIIEAEAT